MPTLKEAKDNVIILSRKALDLVENNDVEPAEKKAALDKIEGDLKKWEEEVADLSRFEDSKKRYLANLAGVHPDTLPGDPAGAGSTPVAEPWRAKSLGQQFVEHDNYRSLIGDGKGTLSGKTGQWTTGGIELKTLLAEGTVAAPGNANPFVATPTVLPGVLSTLFQPTTFSALIPDGATDTPLIRYLVESAVTNAAATVAEGALKSESALTFTRVDEVLKKIATFLPVTDETLEDWQQAMSYIDARLMLFIQLAAEVQELRGDGTGTNLVGIMNRTGLAPTVVTRTPGAVAPNAVGIYSSPTSDTDMDSIYRQITQVRVTSFLEPDNVVVDPGAWQTIQLSKNVTTGTYYAGGPFMGLGVTPNLWGKPVTVTTSMPASTALVGAFGQACQRFSKGGIRVEASNSHTDFFQRNQTAIRAEKRELLAVYRPGAFGIVTTL
jgi:HK97 family phage major capsid protein